MPEHLRRKAQGKLPEPAVSEGHVAGNDTAAKAVLGWTRSRYDGYHKPGWTVGSAVGSQHVFEVPNKMRAKKKLPLIPTLVFLQRGSQPGVGKALFQRQVPTRSASSVHYSSTACKTGVRHTRTFQRRDLHTVPIVY